MAAECPSLDSKHHFLLLVITNKVLDPYLNQFEFIQKFKSDTHLDPCRLHCPEVTPHIDWRDNAVAAARHKLYGEIGKAPIL